MAIPCCKRGQRKSDPIQNSFLTLRIMDSDRPRAGNCEILAFKYMSLPVVSNEGSPRKILRWSICQLWYSDFWRYGRRRERITSIFRTLMDREGGQSYTVSHHIPFYRNRSNESRSPRIFCRSSYINYLFFQNLIITDLKKYLTLQPSLILVNII